MPGGDYRDELRSRGGWTPEPGPILDADGERVGEHGGAAGFTVGQRKGLGVALGEPRYVSRIDPATNAIIARPARGPRDATRSSSRAARSSPTTRRRAAGRTAPGAVPGRRSASGIARRSSTATVRPATASASRHAAVAGSSRPTRRCGPSRPARPASCTTATVPRRRPDRVPAREAEPARDRRARRGAGSAHDHRPGAAARAARRASSTRRSMSSSAATPAAGCRSPTSPRRSARGPGPRSATGSGSTSSRSATSR